MSYRKFNDQELFRRQTLKKLQDSNQDPFAVNRVENKAHIKTIVDKYGVFVESETLGIDTYTLCGRLMSTREPFFDISEEHNSIQCYLNKTITELYEYFKNYVDIGDVVKITGTLFFSKTKTLSVRVSELKIISKCLKPLPEKTLGIKDKELLVRERVASLISDKNLFESLSLRSKILFDLRSFLNKEGYLEVETSILQKIPGGGMAKPFVTHHNELKEDLYLRIAPELPLKKLITAGYNKVFEIGKSFRNEGVDSTHNPEFTSLEIYTAYFGMEETMKLTEKIIHTLAINLNKTKFNWMDKEIDLFKKFNDVNMCELVHQKTGLDFYNPATTYETACSVAQQFNIKLESHENTKGHILHKLFESLIEHTLIEPTFVRGYHIAVSPLSKTDPKNKEFTNRFELFIGGKEIANGFEELNDPIDQLKRFEQQDLEKNLGNEEAMGIDYDYIKDIEYGLPPTGGLGIGIDRLIMLLTEQNTIKNVLFFPHNKNK